MLQSPGSRAGQGERDGLGTPFPSPAHPLIWRVPATGVGATAPRASGKAICPMPWPAALSAAVAVAVAALVAAQLWLGPEDPGPGDWL